MDGRQLADFVGSIVRILEDPARHELEAEAKARALSASLRFTEPVQRMLLCGRPLFLPQSAA